MWILPTDSIRNYVIGYDPARFCISLGLASAHADQPPDRRSVACVVVPGKGVTVSSAFSLVFGSIRLHLGMASRHSVQKKK